METAEQFETVCSLPGIEAVYIDAGLFPAEEYASLAERAHRGKGGIGKRLMLRLPHIWRDRAERFFNENRDRIREAGFDGFLARNPEGVLWLRENLPDPTELTMDHTMYVFNSRTEAELELLCGVTGSRQTCSLELNRAELAALGEGNGPRELVVYGRIPLMVTAQCLRRTALRCDRRASVMVLRDRTGAVLPVKNTCRFCYNTVYNSVPTVLFDLGEELDKVRSDAFRYEFTTETAGEIKGIMAGNVPAGFTRGHFHRGVE